MILAETVLIESKSARNNQLERMSHEGAQSILEKIKTLYFALWNGVGIATTEQLSNFYEVPVGTIRPLLKPHKDEFESDGVRTIRCKALKDARCVIQLPPETSQALIWTPRAALRLGMVLRDSLVAKAVRTSLLDSVEQVIPALSHENERLKLELQLLRARQKYQDSGYAIQMSTSAATLAWLRGETPPPTRIEYKERFIDARTGKEIGSSEGRSLTQMITDAGLNPTSKRDRERVKRALKWCGLDYDRKQGWGKASYLREYPVLEDEVYDRALKAVLGEVAEEPNLFIHQMQQAALSAGTATLGLQGGDE